MSVSITKLLALPLHAPMVHTHGVHIYKLTDGSVRFRVRLFHRGKRWTWSGFLVRREAQDWYQDRKRDLRDGRPFPSPDPSWTAALPERTLAQVIEDYLVTASLKKNFSGERTYADFWTQQLGHTAAAAVTPTAIDAARKSLLRLGASGATINRYVSWCHHVYRLEIEAERLTKNPCRLFVRSGKRGGQKLPERPAPDVVYTDDELRRLAIELGDGILYPLLSLLTGLRREEQFALRKEAIDLERHVIRLHDPKAGTNQLVHLNDDAVRILGYFLEKSGTSPFVFPSPRWPQARPMQAQHWYRSRFIPACARAGILIDRDAGRTWHTLRHSFADRLEQLGVPILDVQAAGRWGSFQAMRRYLKTHAHRVGAAVQQLKSPVALDQFWPTEKESTATDSRKHSK